ncbi:MAG: hypothetical protein AAF493_01730 [Pseudomonadota bacterium]
MPLTSLEQTVRYGRRPDHPTLLYDFLNERHAVVRGLPADNRAAAHLETFNLLLDVICDECVPEPWRHLCLDNIYRPLDAMQCDAKSDDEFQLVRNCYQELRASVAYFLTSRG